MRGVIRSVWDAAATVSLSADDRSPGSLRTYLVLTDSSGVVVDRAAGDHRYGNSSMDRLLLSAGTYTVEVTSNGVEETGGYQLDVWWWAADACVRDLGLLGSSSSSLSGSGVVAQDGSCVSSLRDPGGTSTFYARRHTFSLDAAATVSLSADDRSPGSLRTYLVLTDSSGVVVDRAAGDHRYGNSSMDRLLLSAGTYTVEVTSNGVEETGGYQLDVWWWAADACVRDLGLLGSSSSLSGSGIVAVDGSCVSSLRDPGGTSTFYARRHTFSLDAAATVSLSADDRSPGSLRTYLVLTDSSGVVVDRAAGDHRYGNSSMDRLLLSAGTYTVEVTSNGVEETGGYQLDVWWWAADACVRDLGFVGFFFVVVVGFGGCGSGWFVCGRRCVTLVGLRRFMRGVIRSVWMLRRRCR